MEKSEVCGAVRWAQSVADSRPRRGSDPPVAAARGPTFSPPSDHHPLHPHSVGGTLDTGQAGDTVNTSVNVYSQIFQVDLPGKWGLFCSKLFNLS